MLSTLSLSSLVFNIAVPRVPHYYFNEKLYTSNHKNQSETLSECLRAGMDHLHINVMLNDVPHKSQNNQDSNSGPGVLPDCILSLSCFHPLLDQLSTPKWLKGTSRSADQFSFVPPG